MRILVIGGTNFIGPHVVRALASRGHDVTVYHRGEHEAPLPPTVDHVRHPNAAIPVEEFPEAFLDEPPEIVVHMVAMGQRDAAAMMTAFAGKARRSVVVSSGDVYRAYGRFIQTEPGPPDPSPLTEDAPLRSVMYPYRKLADNPDDWIHHYEKILVERAVMADPRFPATVLRLPGVYGPHDPTRRLFPCVKRMTDGRPAILLDDRKAAWRFTHDFVENAAAAITLAACDDRAAGRTYNVGPVSTPATRQWVGLIGAAAGWKGRIVTLPRDALPAHLREESDFAHDVALDSTRIRAELGYRDAVPVDEGLRRTVAWDRLLPPAKLNLDSFDYDAEDAALGALR